jgi:hypothetical protein
MNKPKQSILAFIASLKTMYPEARYHHAQHPQVEDDSIILTDKKEIQLQAFGVMCVVTQLDDGKISFSADFLMEEDVLKHLGCIQ